MRILVALDEPKGSARADELDVLAQAAAVEAGLRQLGHEVERLGVGLNLHGAQSALQARTPEFVFNLVESLDGVGRFIPYFPGLLDQLGLPYSGSRADALFESSSKLLARRKLAQAGLPVANGWSAAELTGEGSSFQPGRYIIKSVWEHASLGLSEDSILEVGSARELQQAIELRADRLGRDAFAEQFIEGREFNLSVLASSRGPEVLAPAEIRFEGFESHRPRIVGYNAKWDETSFEYQNTQRCFDFSEDESGLLHELRTLASQAFQLFELRGWARVDFRVDSAGRPWILEVNANPCLAPDAGFAAALEQSGIPFAQALERILADSLRPAAGVDRTKRDSSRPAVLSAFSLRQTVRPSDREAVQEIVQSTGFFHSYEVEVAVELVDAHLQHGIASGYHFLFLDGPEGPVGYACFGPTACTDKSFDLYWIAVHNSQRGLGLGRALLLASEAAMAQQGARAVWVETSGRALYEPTRVFYRANQYEQAAVLRDFYAAGDSKVVFVKHLTPSSSTLARNH